MKTRYVIPLFLGLQFGSIGSAQRVVPVGTGVNGFINYMIEYDGKLIIGGTYRSFNDHIRPNIQGWNGTQHIDLPGAFEGVYDQVFALESCERTSTRRKGI